MKVLIVSNSLSSETLTKAPYNLQPEIFTLTSFNSIKWISYNSYSIIIFHKLDKNILHKVALGIYDNNILYGLWKILYDYKKPIYLLEDFQNSEQISDYDSIKGLGYDYSKLLLNLGIERIWPSDIIKIFRDIQFNFPNSFAYESIPNFTNNLVTADDIRNAYKSNIKEIYFKHNQLVTDWAKEVANTLDIKLIENKPKILLLHKPNFNNLENIYKLSDKIKMLCDKHKDIYFLVSPCLIPIFAEAFPSLRNKIVSSVVHWEKQGAFTGETSITMLLDFECRCGILKDTAPYNFPENVKKLLELAKEKNFTIFSEISPQKLEFLISPMYTLETFYNNIAFISNNFDKNRDNSNLIYTNKDINNKISEEKYLKFPFVERI